MIVPRATPAIAERTGTTPPPSAASRDPSPTTGCSPSQPGAGRPRSRADASPPRRRRPATNAVAAKAAATVAADDDRAHADHPSVDEDAGIGLGPPRRADGRPGRSRDGGRRRHGSGQNAGGQPGDGERPRPLHPRDADGPHAGDGVACRAELARRRLEKGKQRNGGGDDRDDSQAVLGQVGRVLDRRPRVGEQVGGDRRDTGRRPRSGAPASTIDARPLRDGPRVDAVVDSQVHDADAGQVRTEPAGERRRPGDRRGLGERDVGGVDAEADDLEIDPRSGRRLVADLVDRHELVMGQARPTEACRRGVSPRERRPARRRAPRRRRQDPGLVPRR